jgi:flavin reductase (DIM6/NTAB) family NADH-FMN oxidoreductase RutF
MTTTLDLAPETTQHVVLDPAILYFGTPVVLLSSLNEDGTTNVAPMSSVFWLGHRGVLGLGASGQTSANLRRHGEVVLNLPSADQVSYVDRLALTTGRADVVAWKERAGYRHVPDKFAHAGLTPVPSATVVPDRVAECPVHLETVVEDWRANADGTLLFDFAVTRVWVRPELRLPGHENRIDPDAWRPLLMSFQQFYGLGERVHPSRLSSIDEETYRR